MPIFRHLYHRKAGVKKLQNVNYFLPFHDFALYSKIFDLPLGKKSNFKAKCLICCTCSDDEGNKKFIRYLRFFQQMKIHFTVNNNQDDQNTDEVSL